MLVYSTYKELVFFMLNSNESQLLTLKFFVGGAPELESRARL